MTKPTGKPRAKPPQKVAKLKDEGASLAPVHDKAIEMHLNGTSISAIAVDLRVNRATVTRWLQQPAIRSAIRERQQLRLLTLRAKGESLVSEMVDVLVGVARDVEAEDKDRVNAASKVLQHFLPDVQKVEVSGPEGTPIVVADATPAVLLAELGALLGMGRKPQEEP